MSETKTVLHRALRGVRDDLRSKLDGLGEREARLPRTGTGTSLLGAVKHCLNVEAAYFGPVFGREFADPSELVALEVYERDPHADWYARHDETKDGLLDLHRRVAAFADETIERLPLDAPGTVPWWVPERQDVTLQVVLVHVLVDLARHVGHTDVMREAHDGAVSLRPGSTNLPAGYDWEEHVSRLTELANRFA